MEENIKYGFINKDGNPCFRKELGDELYENLLYEEAYLQTPNELIINKCGVCYDYVELERKWFLDNGYLVYTYFTPYHNHTILIYSDNAKYYFFERSFKEFNGIYEFDSLEDALYFYLELQIKNSNNKIDSIDLYEYNDVIFGCSIKGFQRHIIDNMKKKVLKFDK